MLRYGIMGTNWLSHIYFDAIHAAGDQVAAVCSRSLERARELGGDGTLAYDDLDEMLKNPDIDVVYLCIPNVLHADAAIRCLKAGKHVLCEKPATISPAQMEEIIRTAKAQNRIFAEAVMNFYSPVMDRLREELKENPVVSARLDYSQRSSKLDKLQAGEHITSFDRKLFGGVLTDLGCYVLHFAVNLFSEPKSLDASAVFIGEVDGTDTLMLHYDGFDVTVNVSKCAHSMIGSEIQCDRATYTLKISPWYWGWRSTPWTPARNMTAALPATSGPLPIPRYCLGFRSGLCAPLTVGWRERTWKKTSGCWRRPTQCRS